MAIIALGTPSGKIALEVELFGSEQIRSRIASWAQTVPGMPIYIDGQVIPDDLRQSILDWFAQQSQPSDVPAPQAAPAPQAPGNQLTPGQFQAFNQHLGQAAAEMLETQFKLVQQAQAFTDWQLETYKKMNATMLERDQRAADEAVRQRRMTHQSLQDIDLLDRSVKVQELIQALSGGTKRGASAPNARTAGSSRSSMDWIHALATVVQGPAPSGADAAEPKPDEKK